ncbi:MAG: hypothetical protein HQL69_10920 [Magnetococcales bacterium]|nr:hypothetical protein [Magnetococcales bacterium]
MKNIALILLLISVLLINIPVTAHSQDNKKKSITWLIWELSPEYIRTGPMKGRGFADQYLDYFIKHLPDFNHNITWTSIPRFHREALLAGRCTPHIWGHFYPNQFAYSKPYTLTPPHVAIFHKSYEKRLGPPGTILSFVDLLGREKFTLMTPKHYEDQRRYPILHPYILPYIGSKQIKQMPHSANEVDLRLIARGRADFSLGYPTTIGAQKIDRGIKGDFIAYDLKEHQTYNNIHVGCFGDAQGREVIAKIDKMFNPAMLESFLKLYEKWNARHPKFRKTFYDKIVSQFEE